jgi:hypothetical protein
MSSFEVLELGYSSKNPTILGKHTKKTEDLSNQGRRIEVAKEISRKREERVCP